MATSFQEGLGIQKKATAKNAVNPYQNLNVIDFIGLGGKREPSDQEKALLELEEKKRLLVQEEAQWKNCSRAVQEVLQELKADFDASKAQLAANLLELTFFLARELLDLEISTQPQALIQSVKKLIDQTIAVESRTLSFNPNDHTFLKEKDASFIESLKAENIAVLEDPNLASGRIKIASPSRQAEMDIQKRLSEIKKQIPANFLTTFTAQPATAPTDLGSDKKEGDGRVE